MAMRIHTTDFVTDHSSFFLLTVHNFEHSQLKLTQLFLLYHVIHKKRKRNCMFLCEYFVKEPNFSFKIVCFLLDSVFFLQ